MFSQILSYIHVYLQTSCSTKDDTFTIIWLIKETYHLQKQWWQELYFWLHESSHWANSLPKFEITHKTDVKSNEETIYIIVLY